MAIFTQSEKLAQIATKAIEEFEELSHLADPGLQIAFLYSDQAKKSNTKVVYADVEVVKEKYRTFIPYQFIITFYEPNCADMDDEHLKRLMYHELLHVGYDGSDKYRIKPHDVEDFRACIEKWGFDWITD